MEEPLRGADEEKNDEEERVKIALHESIRKRLIFFSNYRESISLLFGSSIEMNQ